ncbi:membrane protein [Bifidobacterium moukalabense DSM 27321]|uniref:Membrane protein n=2 Tax=Bifidobacterium moukalabense TaxID=1333651 RepID=W4NBG3_9BIFI|nr:membrane protein [Bifidobacterium moukalabense DSM 27321]
MQAIVSTIVFGFPWQRRHAVEASIRHLTLIDMSLFKKEDKAQEPVEQKAQEPAVGKGRPTPKRKDAQAQNLRPLVPKDRDASRKAAKARMRERENAEYEAMQTGDVNHMPKAERLPWRIYIRDYVDARFNLGEFFIPVAFVILVASIFVTYKWPSLALPLMALMYVYLFAVIIDIAIMWRKLKKKLIEKYGEKSVAKGMRSASYAWSRAIQIRRWRLPKPRYPKRGHWPE